MKRHLAELRSDNLQHTPVAQGKRSKKHFLSGTPIAGLADCHDDHQADTPDSARPGPGAVPGTTERLLAGFSINTPIAGLRLQTPPAPEVGAGDPRNDQENGLPWLQHSQLAPASPRQRQPNAQLPPQPPQHQLQPQQQLSFHAAGAHGAGPAGPEQQSWFGAQTAAPQLQCSQPQQPSAADLLGSCSQQSLSLGHFARGSQQHSEGLTPGGWSGAFGSQQPVEEAPSSLRDDAHGGRGSGDDAMGEGAAARTADARPAAAAGGVAHGSSGQEADTSTPLGAWAQRCMAGAGQQHQQQQEQQQHPHQPAEHHHQRQPPPQLHRHRAPPPQRHWAPEVSPRGRSPLGLPQAWGVEGLLGDSGSRAEAAAAATPPLCEDDFVLKASASYMRAMAVESPLLGADAAHGGAGEGAGHHGGARGGGGGGRGSRGAAGPRGIGALVAEDDDYHTPLHAGSQDGPCSDGAATRLSGLMPPGQCSDAGALTLTAEETTTPELECLGVASQEPPASGGGGRGCEQEAQGAQALFPIFRPRNQRKCILLVRHGESTYNKLDNESKAWSDPSVFDAPLTQRGHSQAAALRGTLHRVVQKRLGETHCSEPLWLVSPLTRAIETFLGSCPHIAERLRPAAGAASPSAAAAAAAGSRSPVTPCHEGGGADGAAAMAAGGGASGCPTPVGSAGASGSGASGGGASGGGSGGGGGGGSVPNVIVLPLIAEHCVTSGDVGRPSSDLARAFPALSGHLRDLEEVWWYNPDPSGRPNCSRRKSLGRREPKDHMRQRVADFTRWLHARPERVIVAFGHSQFWKAFSSSKTSLRNCEFHTMWW